MAEGAISVEVDAISELGLALEEAIKEPIGAAEKDHLPELRSIDQTLYTTVDPSMAVAYTLACGYMHESIVGAAQCFTDLRSDLDATATAWKEADDVSAANFK